MENKEFEVLIVSVPDKENCICEIYFKEFQWVEISKETQTPIIHFFNHPVKDFWEMNPRIAIETLTKACDEYLAGFL